MEAFDFAYAIRPYEEMREGKSYVRTEKNKYERTILGDSTRCLHFLKDETGEEKWCKNVYIYITKKILVETTAEYYQGMFEIASYFVLFYFKDSVPEKYKKIVEKFNGDDFSSDEDDGVVKEQDNMSSFIDEELYRKCSVAITNVLEEKYIPLVENGFSLYKRYNNVFIKMMKARNIHLDPEISMSYMNTTLTWFSRIIENLDDVHKVFAIIISCPPSMPFLMLVHYFSAVKAGQKITRIDKTLYDNLIALEHEFLRTESRIGTGAGFAPTKSLVVGTAVVGLVLGVVIYHFAKKDK